MTQLEAIYREALENIKNTLDGCGMRQDEEMPLSELLLLRVAREALSAPTAQEPPTQKPVKCPKCGGTLNNCGFGTKTCLDCQWVEGVEEPPTETQERC